MKNYKILLLAPLCSVLLLTGCGGGDGDDLDGIKAKKYIFVYHNVLANLCESNLYVSTLSENGFRDLLTKEADNSVTCTSLGKVVQTGTNTGTCVEHYNNLGDDGYGNTSCLLGFQENPDFNLF
ncbi:MAG TPA: hypothetical protein EYG95_03200 [Campylobacterales bacterium]|nr:hypothetical protein [Campylobacterales bacterium]